MPRVVHFEIHAEDPEKLSHFYTEVFGWKIENWPGPVDYWLITTGPDDQPGINGAITKRQAPISGESIIAYICTVDIPDIDQSIEKVKSHGGQVTTEKMAIPGIGYNCYCKDPEGNIFGLMQSDSEAK
jgi:predicted enzyme related to lactoylglutathione lyase